MQLSTLSFLIIIASISISDCHKSLYTRFRNRRPNIVPHILLNGKDSNLLRTLDESLSLCGPYRIDIRELTITKAQEYFHTEKLTSLDLTMCYLKRIAKMDVHLKSVIELNPEAVSLAMKADLERSKLKHTSNAKQKTLSMMHGIPILIKDNIGTADFMETTAGTLFLVGRKPKRDADVVKRLRNSGAVILGKTNLSELAYFRGVGLPSGWSSRGGQTLSPYNMKKDPSGSSTGSGVAVSANFALVAIGTETDGSIISPSSRGALVGLKTTLGTVSTRGVIPIAFSQDVVGPMTRSVEDTAILTSVISDVDLHGCEVDISKCLSDQKFKIGVIKTPFWNASDPLIKKMIPSFVGLLNILKGTRFIKILDLEADTNKSLVSVTPESELTVFFHEFKYSMNKYLRDDVKQLYRNVSISSAPTPITLSNMIEFNNKHPNREGFNQDLLIMAEDTDGLLNKTYLSSLEGNRRKTTRYLEGVLDGRKVDVLASPCYSDDTTLMYSYGAMAGFPTITVPLSVDDEGMPFGVCLLGRPNSEATLMKIAYFIERIQLSHRNVPRFLQK